MSWWSLVGTGISAWSSYKQGQAAEERYEDQARNTQQVAAHNAEISLMDATVAEKDAVAAEQAYGRKLRAHMRQVDQVLGKARTGYGKAGVVTSSGSALDTLVDIARAGAEDAALITNEGKTAYERGKNVAARYRRLADFGLRDAAFQAGLLESAGADAASFGRWDAAGKLAEGLYDYGESEGWFDNAD
jgi:hypothetical protein